MKNNKTNQLIVSVIIPVYNRVEMLKEAIESVLSQSFKDFELIVVDDGSSDKGVKDTLKSYGNKIISIYQKHLGVSAARNNGIKHAKGKFIAFLDSDDIWLKKKLEIQIDFFDKNKDALICQTQETWLRDGKHFNPKKYHKKISGDIFEASLNLCLVSPSAVMIRRKIFEEISLFDESLKACEDYDLWLKISAIYPIYLIDKKLIIKRGGHKDQLSKIGMLDKYRIISLKNILESGKLNKQQMQATMKVFKKKSDIYLNGCKKYGRIEEFENFNSFIKTLNLKCFCI